MSASLSKVAVVIPCFCAKGKVGTVVKEVLQVAEQLADHCQLTVLVVNDACPQNSWREIAPHPQVQVLHHPQNRGVGAATVTGLEAALEQSCQAMVKLDADGQHPPVYLLDLMPHLLALPAGELALVKGSRYRWPSRARAIPWTRQLGSVLLEPMARTALACRNLTDISNGYLGMNRLSTRFILTQNIGPRLEQRYLFESSLLARSVWLGLGIQEFTMLPRYGASWHSSMDSGAMIAPLAWFWLLSATRRISRHYLSSLRLGTMFLLVSCASGALATQLWITRIRPEMAYGSLVSSGTSSSFTTACAMSMLSLLLFLLYDYRSGGEAKSILFQAVLRDLEP